MHMSEEQRLELVARMDVEEVVVVLHKLPDAAQTALYMAMTKDRQVGVSFCMPFFGAP
jgi:Mg/Co/Ni transporter MgtE